MAPVGEPPPERDPSQDPENRDQTSISDTSVVDHEKTDSPPPVPTLTSLPIQKQDVVPNGGLTAWLQVLGSFFLFFASWGVVNAFGAYQTFYDQGTLFQFTSSNISWIGSLQGFLLLLVGPVTGPIYDRGYLRSLLLVGSFFVVFGIMMTSIATKYYQVLLAQGVCIGLGAGCLFVPSVAIIATYFSTRRSIATGLAASGSSIGGVVFPVVFRKLQPRIGFGWSTRIIGFIALASFCVSIATMKVRKLPSKPRSILQLSAFREAPFTLFSVGAFFAFTGLYIPFFYISAYSAKIAGADPNLAFYFLSILNAGSFFGRIIPNYLADLVGPLNVLTPCVVFSAVMCFAWLGITNIPGLVVFAVLYGFWSGAVVSLPPSVIATISPDMSVVGTRIGMSITFAAFGILVGNPIAGALLDLASGEFWKAQVFCACLIMGGAGLMAGSRLARWRTHPGWRG